MCYSWLTHQKYTYGNENNAPVSQDNPLNLLTVYTKYHLRGSMVTIVEWLPFCALIIWYLVLIAFPCPFILSIYYFWNEIPVRDSLTFCILAPPAKRSQKVYCGEKAITDSLHVDLGVAALEMDSRSLHSISSRSPPSFRCFRAGAMEKGLIVTVISDTSFFVLFYFVFQEGWLRYACWSELSAPLPPPGCSPKFLTLNRDL